jgi:peptide/nickel transport system permease protein
MFWLNWSVRIGGIALVLLVLVALLAPWLGTVDPTLFDAASRDLRPGASGEIMTLEGEMKKHTFVMGSDSFGRDVYSRVLYGTRVSLVVGFAAVLVGSRKTDPRIAGSRIAFRSCSSC